MNCQWLETGNPREFSLSSEIVQYQRTIGGERGGGELDRKRKPQCRSGFYRAFHITRCGGSSAQAALEALNKLRLSALFRQVGKVGVDDILKLVIVAVGKH